MDKEAQEFENRLIKYGIIGHVVLGILIGFYYGGIGGALLGAVLGVAAGFMFGITILPLIGILACGGFALAIVAAVVAFIALIAYFWNVGRS